MKITPYYQLDPADPGDAAAIHTLETARDHLWDYLTPEDLSAIHGILFEYSTPALMQAAYALSRAENEFVRVWRAKFPDQELLPQSDYRHLIDPYKAVFFSTLTAVRTARALVLTLHHTLAARETSDGQFKNVVIDYDQLVPASQPDKSQTAG